MYLLAGSFGPEELTYSSSAKRAEEYLKIKSPKRIRDLEDVESHYVG
jgi:hypothetical protein